MELPVGQARAGRAQGRRVRDLTRKRLLATAEEIFLSRGFSATSVDVIADAAGYTTGAVYSNFGGKADLFLAVLEEASARDLAGVRAALGAASTDEQRLAVFTTAVNRDPQRWRARVTATNEFLSYARAHPELQERIRVAQELVDAAAGEIVAALCTALGLPPPAASSEVVRDVLALINGLSIRSLFDDQLDVARASLPGMYALLTGERADIRQLTSLASAERG
jgi:AcrR family transcriptional regulator